MSRPLDFQKIIEGERPQKNFSKARYMGIPYMNHLVSWNFLEILVTVETGDFHITSSRGALPWRCVDS